MKIRTKLITSNILIILIPSFIVLSLIAIFVNGHGASYWESVENIYDDQNRIYSVQGLIEGYNHNEDFDNVKKEMTKAGYHFSVNKDGKQVFSNLNSNDIGIVNSVAGNLADSQSGYTVNDDKYAVVREVYEDEGASYDILAVRISNGHEAGDDSYMKRYLALYIGFILLIMIVSVAILNIALSWWVSKSIIKPLDKLAYGSKLIGEGNLDFDMQADREDEIGMVIKSFDEMKNRLKASVQERLQYEAYRKELITGVSHDLRTPLTSIKGYAEALRDDIPQTEEMKERYYKAIQASADDMEVLISDLTNISRWEDRNKKFDLEKVELNEFIKCSISDFREKHFEDNFDITFDSNAARVYVNIDKNEMERVIVNVFDNSMKYNDKELTKICVDVREDESGVTICIEDNGPGVKIDDVDHIFDCFYRGDASRTMPGKGHGIGLAVVKQVVEGFGGHVSARNGEGFAIDIHLPGIGGKDE